MKALLSNGFNRFILAPLAVEIQRHGALAGLLTAAWPKGWQRDLARAFPRSRAWKRFLDRKEAVNDSLVHSFVLSELLWILSRLGAPMARFREPLESWAFRAYAWRAGAVLRKVRPDIYHYRSCFGLGSVAESRSLGAVTLCDQSIAHPRILPFMVANEGRFPPLGGVEPESTVDRYMERDLSEADHVVVNSDFVKQTCVHAGMDPSRIHVIYLGVEDKYLQSVPNFDQAQIAGRRKPLLYAGGLQTRKGVWQLVDVFGDQSKHLLTAVGSVEPSLSGNARIKAFQRSKQVEVSGYLSRADLAKLMTQHSIFVFPSLCEGSARVVFEAMACGCYIITTPNAGSIVQDGVHGRLVPPGDAPSLSAAVDWATNNLSTVSEVGWRNAQLIRKEYRQHNCGNKVMALYERLLNQK